MSLTEFQKQIYNIYLKVLAKNSGRGYRARQNFDNLSNEAILAVKKLEILFQKHPELDIQQFFQSGFTYRNEKYVPIDYYSTYKAIVAYKKTR